MVRISTISKSDIYFILGVCYPCFMRKASRAASWSCWIKSFHTMPRGFLFLADIRTFVILGCSFVLRSLPKKEAQGKPNCWIPRFLPEDKEYKTSSILSGLGWKFYVINCYDNSAWLLWLRRQVSGPIYESWLASRIDHGWRHDNYVPFLVLHYKNERV